MNKERLNPANPAEQPHQTVDTIESQAWLREFKTKHPLQALIYELKLGNGVWQALKNLFSK